MVEKRKTEYIDLEYPTKTGMVKIHVKHAVDLDQYYPSVYPKFGREVSMILVRSDGGLKMLKKLCERYAKRAEELETVDSVTLFGKHVDDMILELVSKVSFVFRNEKETKFKIKEISKKSGVSKQYCKYVLDELVGMKSIVTFSDGSYRKSRISMITPKKSKTLEQIITTKILDLETEIEYLERGIDYPTGRAIKLLQIETLQNILKEYNKN